MYKIRGYNESNLVSRESKVLIKITWFILKDKKINGFFKYQKAKCLPVFESVHGLEVNGWSVESKSKPVNNRIFQAKRKSCKRHGQILYNTL